MNRASIPSWAIFVGLLALGTSAFAVPQRTTVALADGQVMVGGETRRLSANAGVQQFLYHPSGLEIAYTDHRKSDTGETDYVRTVGVRYGTTTTLMSSSTSLDTNLPGEYPVGSYDLIGWTPDGDFLLVSQQVVQQYVCKIEMT